jgi:hypothetical protein
MKSFWCNTSVTIAAASLCAILAIYDSPQCAAQTSTVTNAPAVSPVSPPDVSIPGPLRSFLRMAGVSQKVSPDEVLPKLARNIAVLGYRETKPSEYLVLLRRYITQARELAMLAGTAGAIRVGNCDQAKPLLDVIGYRLRESCGPNAILETADADRAFLTIDSGFPLANLEESLRSGKPFVYPYPMTPVPALFTTDDWLPEQKKEKNKEDILDAILDDPDTARLYWALSQMDSETRLSLRRTPGLRKLVAFGPVLDFYGGQISIRSGKVVVPGGVPAENAWKELVGASPNSPGEFVARLIEKDEGWLAAYYDALTRVSMKQQAYFADPTRLKRFYEALRGRDLSPSPVRAAYRPDPGLLLLVNRLQFEASGKPIVPGGLEVWKEILERKSNSSKIGREWGKKANGWKNPDELVEGMFAMSRVQSEAGPLPVYLAISEIDRARFGGERLNAATVRTLASNYPYFHDQFPLFTEFPGMSNSSIAHFFNVANSLNHISEADLRSDALGIFQANVGLWQILARQGQISDANLNGSWMQITSPFMNIRSRTQLVDVTQASLTGLFQAAAGKSRLSEGELIALLAGPQQDALEGQQVRQEVATRIRTIMDDQRLVSLDTLLTLSDGLRRMADGKAASDNLLELSGELRETAMPKPLFTSGERSEWAAGVYNGNHHIVMERQTDFSKVIKSTGTAAEYDVARGQLSPFLRDTLVGLNYAYYAPPGGQMIHTNPLFVRMHDFSGEVFVGAEQGWQSPILIGRGSAASGGARLAGSLADLPYSLARAEQNFLVPENVQALIWVEMVPGLLTSAVVPRWWDVSKNELHAVTLYQRAGEELLASAQNNEQLRKEAMDILSDRLLPQRSEKVEEALRTKRIEDILPQITPGEALYLAAEFRRRFPGENDYWGAAGRELESLSQSDPEAVRWERLSRDFGVPHPTLAQNYARELLEVKPFPAVMGSPSRLLAETWDSTNLYWARLADELNYAPVTLNDLVPELTRRMIQKITASDFEDWPAVLRAMRETGDEFRRGGVAWLRTTDGQSEPTRE